MNIHQVRDYLIRPTLKAIPKLDDENAIHILCGTYLQESDNGEYLAQLDDGPAKSPFQIEPKTAVDIYNNYLSYRPQLFEKVEDYRIPTLPLEDNLLGNWYFAIILARLVYYRDSNPLPDYRDAQAVGEYWKRVYNTSKGKGKVSQFVEKYEQYLKEIK